MNHYLKWGIAIFLITSLLSACAAATPTPIFIEPAPVSNAVPQPIPQVVAPRPTTSLPTVITAPTHTEPATTAEGTSSPAPTATLEPHIDRPFLMRIDRISVIVGRGTLLEGRVTNGTLQGGGSVEILGPQNNVISLNLLAILISNTVRDQVTVGDYAGILVEGVTPTELSPGLLLAEAGEYESYEEALRQLQ